MLSENQRAAALMMAAMASFTINDTCTKALAGTVPLYQVLFLRGILTTTAVFFLARRAGALRAGIPRRDLPAASLRTFAEIAAAYFFLTALFNMPIANATAILQALPLTVTLAAALFLGEPVGWRRLAAIAAGFIGVLMIVRPGTEGFTIYSLYSLAAVACVTLRDLSTRRISAQTPTVMVTLYAAAGVTVAFGVASLFVEWQPVSPRSGALIAASALFVLGGYSFSIMAMRLGEVSFVAPFRYTGLLWALALGWLAFGEWPRPLTLAGAGVVVASGLFMLMREARAAPRPVAARATRGNLQ